MVSLHLITQNKKSMNIGGFCAYRGCDGLMCAIGCLIPDDVYNPNMDADCTLWSITRIVGIDEHYHLCCQLQGIHDGEEPSMWPTKLANLAMEFGLDFNL
jgi:hypothetical protein